VLNRNAFQQSKRLAPMLAIITVCDPLVSIALAHFWLHEKLASAPGLVVGELGPLSADAIGVLGLGWTAEEALAIASDCALTADSFRSLC
jgi:hypothetical protein